MQALLFELKFSTKTNLTILPSLSFNEDLNTYYSSISNISEMKDALNKYSGTKNLNKTIPDSWSKIGKKHIQVYEKN